MHRRQSAIAGDSNCHTPPSARIRVIIVDDHPLVLDGLTTLLKEQPDFEIVDRCASDADALEAVRRHQPEILLLDLNLPDMDSLTVARAIHESNTPAKIVLLTAQIDEDQLIKALQLGVSGVVLKEMATKLLV